MRNAVHGGRSTANKRYFRSKLLIELFEKYNVDDIEQLY